MLIIKLQSIHKINLYICIYIFSCLISNSFINILKKYSSSLMNFTIFTHNILFLYHIIISLIHILFIVRILLSNIHFIQVLLILMCLFTNITFNIKLYNTKYIIHIIYIMFINTNKNKNQKMKIENQNWKWNEKLFYFEKVKKIFIIYN